MTQTQQRILEIDGSELASKFAVDSFEVHHHLGEHPLLSVEEVANLADAIPATSIEQKRGDVDAVATDPDAANINGSPGDTARNIDTNGAWMVLKNIEQVDAYRKLIDELLDEVAPLVAGWEGGMNLREGFIFLSAPNSTTPAHTDHEHNFLLQVRGSKEMAIGRFDDPEAEQRHLEKMFAGDRNMDRMPSEPTTYDLRPGDGVYVPPNAPHFVVNGPDVSVSLSITFRTPVTERGAVVHSVNRRLRRFGISPKPPGQHLTLDRAKHGVQRLARRVKRTD